MVVLPPPQVFIYTTNELDPKFHLCVSIENFNLTKTSSETLGLVPLSQMIPFPNDRWSFFVSSTYNSSTVSRYDGASSPGGPDPSLELKWWMKNALIPYNVLQKPTVRGWSIPLTLQFSLVHTLHGSCPTTRHGTVIVIKGEVSKSIFKVQKYSLYGSQKYQRIFNDRFNDIETPRQR